MNVEALTKVIADIRDRLDGGVVSDIGRAEQGVVLPLLGALGWPVFDPTTVVRNHPVGNGTVSCALVGRHSDPAVLLDIESPGTAVTPAGNGQRHAFERIRVATNGAQWAMFFADANRSNPTEPFCSVDLRHSPGEEAANRFLRYLARGAIVTGDALAAAATDQRAVRQRRLAVEALPEAWSQLAAQPTEPLLNLLASQVERLCGARPSREATADFLTTLAGGSGSMDRPTPQRSEPGPPSVPRTAEVERYSFTLDGTTRRFRKGNALLAAVFIEFADRDPSFCPRFHDRFRGTKRLYLARRREDLHPGQPRLDNSTVPLRGGWFLGTHMGSPQKEAMIRKACEIAGIDFDDLRLEMPIAFRKKKNGSLGRKPPPRPRRATGRLREEWFR